MRLKKMSKMRLKRPDYARWRRRGPSRMRLKKSGEEIFGDSSGDVIGRARGVDDRDQCVWVQGACVNAQMVRLQNRDRDYVAAGTFERFELLSQLIML